MPQQCPEGQIRRKAYTRKDGTFVKSTCVKDRGLPGKTPLKRRSLPIPVKGALGKYGYSNIAKTLARDRREALLKGVKDTDYATIIRRINLIANYNKNSNPEVFKRIKSDITWMQKQLAPTYSKSYKKASSGALLSGPGRSQVFKIIPIQRLPKRLPRQAERGPG